MTKPRNFVIGDIHGYHAKLDELLDVVKYRFDTDILISLGDLTDRGPEPIVVIEKLMQVKKLILILGNHDEWCYRYLKYNEAPDQWLSDGGMITMNEYQKNPEVIKRHIIFFEQAKLYYIDDKSRLFVHGGYNPKILFEYQTEDKDVLIWDRSLIKKAVELHHANQTFSEFNEIFVGHTPTQQFSESIPLHISNLWMLDTGVYLEGTLTIMDVETKEYWQTREI